MPQFAIAIEKWRIRYGPHVAGWVAAIGEFEAMSSLACFAYEHPDAVFPELADSSERFYDAQALTHPLIPAAEAIANDVKLGGDTRLWIISGSNMSGKSTLLRAVGLSVVLGWAGAPVTATRLRLSRLCLGASMRTNDSVIDHRSRFYAEISRLERRRRLGAFRPAAAVSAGRVAQRDQFSRSPVGRASAVARFGRSATRSAWRPRMIWRWPRSPNSLSGRALQCSFRGSPGGRRDSLRLPFAARRGRRAGTLWS